MRAIAMLQLRQLLGERKFLLVVGFLSLPVALTLLIRFGGGMPPDRDLDVFTGIYLFILYPQSVSIVLALLYGTAILNAEIQQRTITYLFTRSLRKWQIVLSKYLVNVAVLATATLPSLLISWLVLGTPGSTGTLLGVGVAVIAATIAYNAIFGLVGVIFSRRAMIIGLVFAGVFEFLLSFVPAVVNTLTVTYYLRSVALYFADLDVPVEVTLAIADASMPVSLAYPIGAAAVALVLTSWIAAQREFATQDEP